ncbi:DNA-binding response regulator [Paenibacillus sp. 1011MAR3C5]|uniref:response regulator transcription factor n=1 Tax=Paenibacillus sp. 1011MAR3C5 TaxID=1675787 RepID=UPI000E6D3D59|nr:response regulator transcription factor [Paenibacillus sp. 1011MAR3C5]RJE90886.1 DNA-binding response regulator [Paenibacillus sp. 1011MAR3C5]
MNTTKSILIIEDEQDISRVLRDYLVKQGFAADTADNGVEGMRMLAASAYDYVILDIMLPDIDGIELCRRIRESSQVPILILSARDSNTDKVLGLGFGADDYMTKPFSLSELVARIQAHFRRYDSVVMPKQPVGSALQAGPITIDRKSYRVTLHEQEVSLSAKEFELLHHLIKHRNQVFSKNQLLDAVWGYGVYGDENTVTVYIRRLREKLEKDPSSPKMLKTVWGVGYKFNEDLESE